MINQNIKDFILNLNVNKIPLQRKNSLNTIISELKKNNDLNLSSKLNFICTHNSRRSQLCQIWSEIIFNYYGFTRIHSFSGGTEVTNVNKRIIKILIESGFSIKQNKHISNPEYIVKCGKIKEIKLTSKLYNDIQNPANNFIAVMNCSSAEKNCPIIDGASKIISLQFDDPGEFDESSLENEKYRETNIDIASSIKYICINI